MGPGRNGGSSGGYSALAVPKTTLARPFHFYWQVSSHARVVVISLGYHDISLLATTSIYSL